MGHWQLLELTPQADERSIKRAYARLLKANRPDDDPEAFQRMREAYEAALAEVRWNARDDSPILEALSKPSAPSPVSEPDPQRSLPLMPLTPVEPFAPLMPLAPVEPPSAPSPKPPSMAQMQQWLADDQERQALDALHEWLGSDWLLPLDRREQFEQNLLDCLESAPHWSPAFFERVCQAMGWDEAQGLIPCAYPRWDSLTRRCEVHAMATTVRSHLDRFDADPSVYKETALLLKPMSDRHRRSLADTFTDRDWQRFTEFAQTLEHRYPEVPERLGLQALDNWRHWLPSGVRGVCVFLWLSLSLVLMATSVAGPKDYGIVVTLLLPLFVMVMGLLGVTVHRIWTFLAVLLAAIDVPLSRRLLPSTWYRQGAGLLLIRHVLPSAVPAGLVFVWCQGMPWLQWSCPGLVFVGTLYFANKALSGESVPMWGRVSGAIKLMLGRFLRR